MMVNDRWCKNVQVLSKSCSPVLETLFLKCNPFYSPREFANVIVATVYIPVFTSGDSATRAIRELADKVTAVENENPDSIVLVLGDFNHTKLSSFLPKYKNQVTCPTREGKILDHCYSTIPNAYRSVSRAQLGRSDHSTVLLIPTYRQRLKVMKPVKVQTRCWTDSAKENLQSCFDITDWSVFRDACTSFHEYVDTVTSYVHFCEDVCIPVKTKLKYSNTKPWCTKTVRQKIVEKDSLYKSGNKPLFNKAKREAEKEMDKAKENYKQKLEEKFASGNTREVWSGLYDITQMKKKAAFDNSDPTLPDKLNEFYARFDKKVNENSA